MSRLSMSRTSPAVMPIIHYKHYRNETFYINDRSFNRGYKDCVFENCEFEPGDYSIIEFIDCEFIGNVPPKHKKACPKEGTFRAYKALPNNILLELEIPEDAKRSCSTSPKCRANKVITRKIYDISRNPVPLDADYRFISANPSYSIDDISEKLKGFAVTSAKGGIYRLDGFTESDSWDENEWNECSNGIHFFMDINDACDWGFRHYFWR